MAVLGNKSLGVCEKFDFVNNSKVVALAVNHLSVDSGCQLSTRRSLCYPNRGETRVLEQ